ncbi:ribbon-helix-helix protein, CopG family [Stetteria hydrogenophila]
MEAHDEVNAMKVVSFKVEDDLFEMLERIARSRGVTKSELIRRAVRKYILENGEERRIIATRKIKIYL